MSAVNQGNRTFDIKLREADWILAGEFSYCATLLKGRREAKLNRDRPTALTLESLTRRQNPQLPPAV